MAQAKDIIRTDSLVKILGNRVILYDVSFDVKEGEIFGLIGPSGSGKTTLLRTLIGFFKPEKGDILVRSKVIPGRQHELYTSVTKETDAVKRVFGFASQHPSVYMELSAQENLEYFAALHGMNGMDAHKTINILLKLMDLESARHRRAKHLSGGMQRRLDIACAMVHRPRILILDEPTADLDPFLRKHVWDMIRKINEKGTTVIVSSHQLSDLEQVCSRVGIIHGGKVVAVDTPEKIKKQFIVGERIRLQTYPGKYKKLSKILEAKFISDIAVEGQELVITTTNSEKCLKLIMTAVQETKESLTSIEVEATNLDQVFLQIAGDNQ